MNIAIDDESENEKPRDGLLGRNEIESKLGRSYKADSRAAELGSGKQGMDRHKLTEAGEGGAEIDTFLSEIRLSAEFYVTW
jgi:hypothetical protein